MRRKIIILFAQVNKKRKTATFVNLTEFNTDCELYIKQTCDGCFTTFMKFLTAIVSNVYLFCFVCRFWS